MLKNLIRDVLRFFLPRVWYIKLRFLLSHGYMLDVHNPKKFVEKIQYRKLHCNNEYYSNFVDKYHVREYVKKCIGEEYLIPIIGVYDSISSDILESIPVPFVIKASHGGGGKFVKIVKDKECVNFKKLAKEFNSLLKIKAGSKIDELFYDVKKPRILIEKAILNNGKPPLDYKFHVFNGRCSFIQIDERDNSSHRMSILDCDFSEMPCKLNSKIDTIQPEHVIKPNRIESLISLVEKISANFDYVRVDMYSNNDQIYFGEITFCPSSGWSKIDPPEWDEELGALWKLNMSNP